MSKNVKVNGVEYSGISTVALPTVNGGTATFKDTDEIVTPSGSKTITSNGTHDVTNFASVLVNIATSGGSSGGSGSAKITSGEYTVSEDNIYPSNEIIQHGLGVVPDIIYFIAENAEQFLGNGETLSLGGVWIKHPVTMKLGGATEKYTTNVFISGGTNNYCDCSSVAGTRPRTPEPTETDFCLWNFNNAYKLKGTKYIWYAVKLS